MGQGSHETTHFDVTVNVFKTPLIVEHAQVSTGMISTRRGSDQESVRESLALIKERDTEL